MNTDRETIRGIPLMTSLSSLHMQRSMTTNNSDITGVIGNGQRSRV